MPQQLNEKKAGWMLRYVVPIGLVAFALFNMRCMYTINGNPEVNLTRVTLTPYSVAMAPGGSFPLKATIADYLHDNTLLWFFTTGTAGAIQANGTNAIFTAPDTLVGDPSFVNIRVQSTEDSSAHADCQVTITSNNIPPNAEFYVDPFDVTLPIGGQFAFKARSTKGAAPAVTWKVIDGPGTITSDGVYSAPATVAKDASVTIEAFKTSDTSVNSIATLTIRNSADTSICFTRDIQPIFINSCAMSGCHSGGGGGAFSLVTYNDILKEVTPGDARASRIYRSVTELNQNNRMPPPPHPALTSFAVRTLGRWINEGALNTNCQ